MSATSTDDAAQRRAARRRRLQQRQTVILGGLVTVLLVVGLVALAMWTGLLPAPFSREFSAEEEETTAAVQPCPPPDAVPVELASVTANVYNGTDRPGLAGDTGNALTALGVVVNQTANWPDGSYPGTVQIVTGPAGVTAAYSVARVFPDAVVTLDSAREDESVDVVLGAGHQGMLSQEQVDQLDPAAPLVAPEGCQPVDDAA
ncbi:LytR C-terminal domain-containing protein [Georgenia sp. TF02-10]|uniref:LytR C-terminal domain-containing protein n=1 Tax=Georgenia sp. TF02-10 TaxID=2917725 RepID=UPI001FA817D4|nr:LytR C-terminal domain-containing protein [Georgenia sp. TF02-10]UNX55212.1 LytR C-terminal domain-containing protein [Georgenia sp. TF02-10]